MDEAHPREPSERPEPKSKVETITIAPGGKSQERSLRVKCPHCGNDVHFIEPVAAEVVCSGCGSSFHVDAAATISHSPTSLPHFIGKFQVLEQLGYGAFGAVYKARDPQLQRLVAVKVPRAGSFGSVGEEERFLREARAAAQLSHPGIVPVLEIAHDQGLPYIVSEYIAGLTLADLLTGRRPSFSESAELIAAIADALDYAHRQDIVHRDVKPSNLLLDDAGRPHLTDFGLARRGEAEITVTLDGQILGTPAYMAPEQAAGDQKQVDSRSDIYSLGVILYELLTGELPFRGNQRMLLHQVLNDDPRPPRSLNDRVPRDLETICLKAMSKVPSRRYTSALEMGDDLRRFLKGDPIRARPMGWSEKISRWARRNPTVAALASAVALLLVTISAVAVSFGLYQKQANRELAAAKENAERSQREAELRAAGAVVDLDLKNCEDGDTVYGLLRLAHDLREVPPHATELRDCLEMNLLAWAQEFRSLGPTFQFDGSEKKNSWQLSPDGLTVLTIGSDGTVRLWDSFTGKVRAAFRPPGGIADSGGPTKYGEDSPWVWFSDNGRVVITVTEDRKTVRMWNVGDGQHLGAAEHPEPVETALLSHNGERLLTTYHVTQDDNAEKAIPTLWRTANGKRLAELSGHSGHVNAAIFSSEGNFVLTGGVDKTARLWSGDTGKQIAILQDPDGPVIDVAFSPDGKVAVTLATVGENNQPQQHVRWWDPILSKEIASPCSVSLGGSLNVINRDVAVVNPTGFGGFAAFNGISGLSGMLGVGGFAGGGMLGIGGLAGGGMLGGGSPLNAFGNSGVLGASGMNGTPTMRSSVCIRGTEKPFVASSVGPICWADADFVYDSAGRKYDRKTGKRLSVSTGRFFSPELTHFAENKRFIVLHPVGSFSGSTPLSDGILIDLRTEKGIGKIKDPSGEPAYVPDRKAFIAQSWPSPRYVFIPGAPLDVEISRLFAEVVTLHEIDPSGTIQPLNESAWEQRRGHLLQQLGEQTVPAIIQRVASDSWYWLRRNAELAKESVNASQLIADKKEQLRFLKEQIKYLDRLVAAEPTWQNYEQRANAHAEIGWPELDEEVTEWGGEKLAVHQLEAARDFLEAARIAGDGYWYRLNAEQEEQATQQREQQLRQSVVNYCKELPATASHTRAEYEVALKFTEALNRVFPDSDEWRTLLPIAHFRLGHYADALGILAPKRRDLFRAVAAESGALLMPGFPLAVVDTLQVDWSVVQAIAFIAMSHHGRGQTLEARAGLAELHAIKDFPKVVINQNQRTVLRWSDDEKYLALLRETEALIEGKSQPVK